MLLPPVRDARSAYIKTRERASYEFALVSAAAVVELDAGRITNARLALGGVAPRPWRLPQAEQALRSADIQDVASLRMAIDAGMIGATPGRQNGFKVELAARTAVRALQVAGGVA